MNTKVNSNKPQGSLIAYMSGLVKQFGGINLAQGLPGFPPPHELLEELRSVISGNFHQYPQGNGDPELIDCIRSSYQDFHTLKTDQILVLQGATEGISLLYLYLINEFGKNWSSLAFDPIYESYAQLPGIYGNQLVRMKFDSDNSIPWEQLSEQILTQNVKLIFVNSPGNPYGRIWSESELIRLMEMAKEQDFYVLFDAVYKDLYFDAKPPYNPINELNDRLFYVDSFSKMLSITGWRIGYLICHSKHMNKIQQIHAYTGLCAPSLLQKAIANYLGNNMFGLEYLKNLRKQLAESCSLISNELESLGFQFDEARAGYFLWTKLPDMQLNGMDFCLKLYQEQKVAMVPGIHFSEEGDYFVRINFAKKPDELNKAISGIYQFIKT